MPAFKDPLAFAVFLDSLIPEIKAAEERALAKGAKRIQVKSKGKIGTYQPASGPFPAWEPLAEFTVKQREEQGFTPDDPLLREGILRASIEWCSDGHEARVGVPSRVVEHSYESKPRDIGDIAIDMEFGTSRAPPRPFLGPAAFEEAPEIAKAVAQEVVGAMLDLPVVPDTIDEGDV